MTVHYRAVHLKLQPALTTKPTPRPLSLVRGLAGALVALTATLGAAQAQAAACTSTTVLHAETNGVDVQDGLGWATAKTLQGALSTANVDASPARCYEIRVKQGVYKPTASTDRIISFAIARPLQLKGGYTGNTAVPNERVLLPRNTVLSGDIDGNDTVNSDGVTAVAADIQGSNSYHVLTIGGITSSSAGGPYSDDANDSHYTLLEGFSITGGLANYFSYSALSYGGGLYCNGTDVASICSPSIRYASFSGNSAKFGGAILNDGSYAGTSSPNVSYATFSGNSAGSGGAMYNLGNTGTSIPSISYATFTGNSANGEGGAIYNYAAYGMSSPSIRYATFSGNSAYEGGAIYSNGLNGSSAPAITASILWGNTAIFLGSGSQISSDSATPTVSASIVEGGWAGAGTGNLATDPLLGPLQDNGGLTLTMLPGAGSPAIDAVACNVTGTLAIDDQRGVARPQGAACDIGAVEVKKSTRTDTPPGATDPITVSFTGGNATCDYASTQFISAAAAGGALPAGYTFAQGAFGFTTTQCGAGAALNVTLTFAQPVPTGAQLFKSDGSAWTALAANINGNTVTYTVIDGGAGDTNPITGVITDPVALGLPIAGFGTATPVPTLGQWALVLLSLLVASLGALVVRRRALVNF